MAEIFVKINIELLENDAYLATSDDLPGLVAQMNLGFNTRCRINTIKPSISLHLFTIHFLLSTSPTPITQLPNYPIHAALFSFVSAIILFTISCIASPAGAFA